MTPRSTKWLFEKEREAMEKGLIAMFLYQNEDVRIKHQNALAAINPDPIIRFLTVTPYFDESRFPFVAARDSEFPSVFVLKNVRHLRFGGGLNLAFLS